MNIFAIDLDPYKCVERYHNKHVVKMLLETAQMLCALHPPGTAPYKRTHYNHPCTKWARLNRSNYFWLCNLGNALAVEYTQRYGKIHKSEAVIEWCTDNVPEDIPHGSLTDFVQVMPEEFKVSGDSIKAYNKYYCHKLEEMSNGRGATR